MSELLNLLREEAVSLVESDLPSPEELRPLFGALASRLERFEKQVLGELAPPPVKEPVTGGEAGNSVPAQTGPAAPPPPPASTETSTAAAGVRAVPGEAAVAPSAAASTGPADVEAELAAAKARVAELEAEAQAQGQSQA